MKERSPTYSHLHATATWLIDAWFCDIPFMGSNIRRVSVCGFAEMTLKPMCQAHDYGPARHGYLQWESNLSTYCKLPRNDIIRYSLRRKLVGFTLLHKSLARGVLIKKGFPGMLLLLRHEGVEQSSVRIT